MSRFVYADPDSLPHRDRQSISKLYRADEAVAARMLLERLPQDEESGTRTRYLARGLVKGMIQAQKRQSGMAALMQEYDLSSDEGIALMCLAEALLRVPDKATADRLIHDKLTASHWDAHLGRDRPFLVNAATWSLWLSERIIDTDDRRRWLSRVVHRMLARIGSPVIRTAVRRTMGMLGDGFVLGRTIDEAMKRARRNEKHGYLYSYDMLGEAARTEEDAQAYFQAYKDAIVRIGKSVDPRITMRERPGISVKLSALDNRYEPGHEERVHRRLMPRILELCQLARDYYIPLCIDAEESWRLDLSLDVVERLLDESSLENWEGLGVAVQAYQKRAWEVLGWLENKAALKRRQLMVRLVKGAYWDTEIKDSQVQGLSDYPVFTRKAATDVSYLACARHLLHDCPHLYPQFATHNAHTVAAVMEMAQGKEFELQRLHGMGEALFDQLVGRDTPKVPCRIYAPVGSHEHLLAYLVRRLLENGANSSFVHRIHEDDLEHLIADPAAQLRICEPLRNPRIALPKDIYGKARRNSAGLDFSDRSLLLKLSAQMTQLAGKGWRGGPLVAGTMRTDQAQAVISPADAQCQPGKMTWAGERDVKAALEAADAAWPDWEATPAEDRAQILKKVADLYEKHQAELMSLCVEEAGKSLRDAHAEVREAVDFCRYYAAQARRLFSRSAVLPGPTGERNELSLRGRGTFLCISPWNFPLAIFTGQVTAALAAGNAVVAKPAEQTSLVATRAVTLMHQAGIPVNVLHCLPGPGGEIGPLLVSDPRIKGVAFTGSNETARLINQGLAEREGPIVPLIAETGGINAMIVDSTALHEQVVMDIVRSAFLSAGQRCSALRLLCVQADIVKPLLKMLKGAMDSLVVGDPRWLVTDVGPVIDAEALERLEAHHQTMEEHGRVLHRAPLGGDCEQGFFMAPSLYRLESIDELMAEVFGPMLHVVTWRARELDSLVDQINDLGFGLTLGIHSRIDAHAEAVTRRARVGNAYVNRDMVGAVVGTQPFGGEGLSGTGFKAGGPHYLLKFATERVVTMNTAAVGGNASLFAMAEGDGGGGTNGHGGGNGQKRLPPPQSVSRRRSAG
ncbi:bifunctional proline dehydrogenase/L-glutamate gamma-semialdehyde dehydrogenase PutA [Ectothiorhodospira variabilis]|uniref:bifunctional proline dehydrogenase/L-glutamate gamma-semialdehyde dehydrogenase PutA n=1 Tax=Ectothiorhodospira variabilis TaxID=505694 RepID=UPI001EFADBD4|nr:bifunctional proline dehydrogenase/L-glutamate gamma-semialdehyde dehydrogenase PutA [Ectothiorhodospira variabilis]MCG5497694.1 bifunctional proline dehydrogenase/L-glutamate gamma-semialdehyde dehydrogenase PutA [Ectothiorhodospira variabilis]